MVTLTRAQRVAALALLELSEQASDEEIQQAYRRLAKQTHPDATGATGTEAGRRFAAISHAYHQLLSSEAPPAPNTVRYAPPRRQSMFGNRTRRPDLVAGPVWITPSTDSSPWPGRRP